MSKKFTWVILILLACGLVSYEASAPRVQNKNDTIKIGSIAARTGVGAAVGEEEYRGAALAVSEINAAGGIKGRQLELVSEDVSLDKLKVAASATSKLIDIDKVYAIVGTQWDEPAVVVVPIINKAQVPMIGADNTDDIKSPASSQTGTSSQVQDPYPYFFSTWYDNRVGIDELLRYAQKQNLKKIAIIRPIAQGFWEFTARAMVSKAPDYGISIVDNIDLGDPLLTDFRTSITKVKADKPDAVFIVVSDYNECTFMKQAYELGLNVPVLSTEAAGNYVALKGCPALLENMYFSTPKHTAGYAAFSDAFAKQFGAAPQFPSAVTAYDAVKVIASALLKSDFARGAALRDAIASTTITGASAPSVSFKPNGFVVTPPDAFEMQSVRNGSFTASF